MAKTQARALRPWTAAISFAHVFTSPRLRARATCELAGLGRQAIIEPDLAEWNYGDYEGRRSADIWEGRPGWNIFRDGCPNGEPPDEIGARADRLIARLRGLGGDVALFAHGQLGGVFVARWIGLATAEGGHFSVGPASMGVLSWDRDHPRFPSSRSGTRRRAFRHKTRAGALRGAAIRARPRSPRGAADHACDRRHDVVLSDTASGSAPRPGRARDCAEDRR